MKVLVREYTTYGKGDNETLVNEYVIEDTKENRLVILDNFKYVDDWDNDSEDFVNGKIDYIGYYNYGDWDDPTGGFITISTREDVLKEIEEKYIKEKTNIIEMFKGE